MSKVKKFVSILSASMLCLSLASCGEKAVPNEVSSQACESNEAEAVIQTVYVQPQTAKQPIYNHVALQGAVIVEQDGGLTFKFKKKCEICGYVASGYSSLTTSAGYNSSFHCPDCGNNQKIQLETTKQ